MVYQIITIILFVKLFWVHIIPKLLMQDLPGEKLSEDIQQNSSAISFLQRKLKAECGTP